MVRPGSPASVWGVAGKAGYALSCVAAALVLAVSGFSYFFVSDVSAIGGEGPGARETDAVGAARAGDERNLSAEVHAGTPREVSASTASANTAVWPSTSAVV